MGQSNARQRLDIIKENVEEITKKIQSQELSMADRTRSHDILIEYVKELKFILSKNIRAARIRKVEMLIVTALEELATLEGTFKNVEPRLKAKSLQTLTDIEEDMKTMNISLTNQGFENEKEAISNYRRRLSLIEEVDQEVGVKKNKVLDVVTSVENVFNELEIEEKLKVAERKHYQSRLDLSRYVGMPDSDSYKEHKHHLLQVKNEVEQILEVNEKVKERKKYLLYNIENNITALDQKVKKNEENINRQINEEEIFEMAPVKNNSVLIDDVVVAYNEFERSFSANCTLRELQSIFHKLGELKVKIDQKLLVLEHQIEVQDIDPYVQLVPMKENGGPSVLVKENDDPAVQRVTITEDFVDGAVISGLLVKNKMEEIQRNVQDLQSQITNSRYSRESHVFNEFKKKLEDCRIELEELPRNDDKLFHKISTDIDSTLTLLENNVSERRSTTGDLLVDIMSIGSVVNDVGAQLRKSDNTFEDYDSMERTLQEHLYYLRKLEIPPTRGNICKFRDYVLIQIDSYLSNLEKSKIKMRSAELVGGNGAFGLETRREINIS